jgi:hypothetical protein
MIIRVAHREHFTVIRNKTLRDSRLSFKARGLLAYLLSLPDDTSLDRRRLEGAGPDGAHAIRMGLQELTNAGYLRHEKRQDELGRWRTEATLYEVPKAPRTGGGKSATGMRLSAVGKSATKSRSNKEKGPRFQESGGAPSSLDEILKQLARRVPDA